MESDYVYERVMTSREVQDRVQNHVNQFEKEQEKIRSIEIKQKITEIKGELCLIGFQHIYKFNQMILDECLKKNTDEQIRQNIEKQKALLNPEDVCNLSAKVNKVYSQVEKTGAHIESFVHAMQGYNEVLSLINSQFITNINDDLFQSVSSPADVIFIYNKFMPNMINNLSDYFQYPEGTTIIRQNTPIMFTSHTELISDISAGMLILHMRFCNQYNITEQMQDDEIYKILIDFKDQAQQSLNKETDDIEISGNVPTTEDE